MHRTPLFCAVALATLCSPALTQDSPRDAWRAFIRDHGASWTVEWTPATGTPSAIFGRGLDLPGAAPTIEEARRRAIATLDTYAQLMGRGSSTFVERIGARMANVWSFVYDQNFRGLQVIGGRADVRVHKTGGISLFGSTAFPSAADFSIVPIVSKADARTAAHAERDVEAPVGPLDAEDARLVIWGDVAASERSDARLAWEVRVAASAKLVGRSYVDAKTGKVLRYVSDYHECHLGCSHSSLSSARSRLLKARELKARARKARIAKAPVVRVKHGLPMPGPRALVPVTGRVQGWTNRGLRPLDALSLTPMSNIRVQVAGGNSGFTDANGNFSIPHSGTAPVGVTVTFVGRHVRSVNPSRGTRMNTTVQVTPGTPATITIYTPSAGEDDRAQITGYWGTDDIHKWLTAINGTLPSSINGVTVNTSLPRSCNAFFSGGANSINFYNRGGSCNMTCYSTVIYHEWGHAIDFAYGGISQTDGLSEGWGDICAIYRTGQPVVGDAFRTSGGAIRTALNTRTYPAGGGVHQQGQTWMGFAWDVRQNLRTRKGAAGVAIAERIVMTTLAANARNQPAAVREVFIADDDDNNLDNGTPNYVDLEAAAKKRTLPFPQKKFTDPGRYTSFGAGCRGTGSVSASCLSLNTTGSLRGSSGFTGVRYMLEIVAPRNLVVEGFEIRQSSRRSGSVTIPTFLYNATQAGQPGTALATGTMSVASAAALYSTRLNRPVSIAQGQRFFIGFQNPNPTITVGTLTSGTTVPYWRNNGSGGSWVRFTTRPWGYRVLCSTAGGAIPTLANTGTPVVGVPFSIDLGQAAASVPAALFVGSSDKLWNTVPLPLDLTAAGAQGCSVLTSVDFLLPVVTNSAGAAKLTIPVPNDLRLHTARFFNQFVVIDTKANALGVALSNGGAGVIGKQ